MALTPEQWQERREAEARLEKAREKQERAEKYNLERRRSNARDGFLDAQKERDEAMPLDDKNRRLRHKSESLSYQALAKIYLGEPYRLQQQPEEDGKRKKKIKAITPADSVILSHDHSQYVTKLDLADGFDAWLADRDRARKDLFWFGQTVLSKDLVEHVHQTVCDQFVKKNFDGVFVDGYTLGDLHRGIDKQERYDQYGNPTKEMMLLDSRGFFKSTIDGIDVAQWFINCPDIRIFLISGEYKLGIAFLKEIKGYFYLPEGADPTVFHLLFPEYIVKGVDGTSKEPLTFDIRRHIQKEPSIWINSIDSNLSGWHCDIKKGDDVVTDENSNNEDTRLALKEKYDGTDNIVDPWGFVDHIGTRYFPTDWYGTRLTAYRDNPIESAIKYFCRACWSVKPEFVEVLLKDLTADMVICTFPEKEPFWKLRKKLLVNERSFRCQQLNEPAGEDEDAFKVQFEEEVLKRHCYPIQNAPKDGEIFIAWDWALTANKRSDWSVGVAARVYLKSQDAMTGVKTWALCVLEVTYGKWKDSELAINMVAFNKRWNPRKTLIERSPGYDLLNLEISRKANLYGTTMDIFWKQPVAHENAKRNRIKSLETLLADDRLFFVIGPWLDETFSQLTRYTGEKKNKGRKDDIPDAMSYLPYFFPENSAGTSDSEEARLALEQLKIQARIKANYNRMFGGNQPPAPPEPDNDPRPPKNPRDIFGGNGLRALRP